MKVIVMCEQSQAVCKAFRDRGHEAYSCDILPAGGGYPQWHIQSDGDMHSKDILYSGQYGWDMLIGHPPCTYITATAAKWLKDQPARKSGALVGADRREAQRQAIIFFKMLLHAPVKKICIENPVGAMSNYRKPSQIIQPYEFGHPEPKKTCLWLVGLPLLKATKIVTPEYHITKSGKRVPKWFFYADKSKGQEHRAGIRSVTFPGIADAMADQWGIVHAQPTIFDL